jgi:hypothetical protein
MEFYGGLDTLTLKPPAKGPEWYFEEIKYFSRTSAGMFEGKMFI